MKYIITYILLFVCCLPAAFSQTLAEAKTLYLNGEFAKALPIFENEYNLKPTDANLNQWYGVCLFETNKDLKKAEECLLVASKRKISDSFLYLGQLYTQGFRLTEAKDAFDKYEAMLKKKDDAGHARLEANRKILSRLNRMVSSTEDIQIIDSIIVNKKDFLSAYKLSLSSGSLDYFINVFSANKPIESVVYFNEKKTKIYFGQTVNDNTYSLFSMEKLLDEYGNEKKLSPNNFGITGNTNYPYMMADGVTIYFAAEDEETLGGYDLFVSRYNMNNDTFLTPERLNMPFNSMYNDYMMAVDEEKGVGWFASDRFQPEGRVCIYTFIPNNVVKAVESDDDKYMADRAQILSIKNSWAKGKDYSQLIALARKAPQEKVKEVRDFEFVVNDKYTYYKLPDFKNKEARDTYNKATQLKTELKSLDKKLEVLRTDYSESPQNKKRNMTDEILRLEKQQEQIQKEIPVLEAQARNQEIMSF